MAIRQATQILVDSEFDIQKEGIKSEPGIIVYVRDSGKILMGTKDQGFVDTTA